MMRNVVIAGYARSPFTLARKGALTKVRPDDLTAQVIKALVERTGVDPKAIEDVIVGCAFPEGEQGLNVARLISFLAGLPQEAAGTTVNRFRSAEHTSELQSLMHISDAVSCLIKKQSIESKL